MKFLQAKNFLFRVFRGKNFNFGNDVIRGYGQAENICFLNLTAIFLLLRQKKCIIINSNRND